MTNGTDTFPRSVYGDLVLGALPLVSLSLESTRAWGWEPCATFLPPASSPSLGGAGLHLRAGGPEQRPLQGADLSASVAFCTKRLL